MDPKVSAVTWTELVQQTETVVDHLDLEAAGGLYRVLLLASTLQVDLSFWPHGHFPTGNDSVQVIFGDTAPQLEPALAAEDLSSLVRMGWLASDQLWGADGPGKRCGCWTGSATGWSRCSVCDSDSRAPKVEESTASPQQP